MPTPVSLSTPLRAALVGALTLTAAACGGGDTPIGAPKPLVLAFSAEPLVVAPGQTTMLRYEVTGAQRVRIATAAGQSVLPETTANEGSVVSNGLQDTTTFVLTAENGAGVATSSVTVTVDDPNRPRVDEFTATPSTITEGESATLGWRSANGVGARVEVAGAQVYGVPVEQLAAGQWVVTPAATTTYTFVLVTNDGSTVEESATVTVNPPAGGPMITSFTADPTTVMSGQPSTLRWAATEATSVRLTDDTGAVVYEGGDLSGSQTVSPLGSTTYTLTARNDAGAMATATVVVTVTGPVPARVVSFAATPASINPGDSSTLGWQVQDAPGGVRIEAGGSPVHTDVAASGTFAVTPATTTEYTLTAISPNGDDTAMATVTVVPVVTPDPQILTLTANPLIGVLGATTDISWTTQDADSVRVLEGATERYASTASVAAGTYAATLSAETTVFTLEALAAGRPTASQTVTVHAHPVPTTAAFSANPAVIRGPTNVTVAWDVTGVSALTLTQDGVAVPSFPVVTSTGAAIASQGSLLLSLSAAATFELTATSAAGTATRQVRVEAFTPVIEIEPNDQIAQAQPLAGAATVNGNLTPADDLDIYRVTVGAGGNVFAETSDGMGGCATDTVLILADSTGTTITVDDNSGTGTCARIDPTVDGAAGDLAAGDYLIGVLHSLPTGTGAYTLDVRVGTPACGNGVLEGTTNEQCDYGDVVPGDGCSATCQLEINPTVVSGTGGTVQVNLPSPNAIAVIQVDVTGGQSITATAADVGGVTCNSVNTALSLGDSTLALVGRKADGGPTGTAGDCATIRFPEDGFAADLPAGSYYLLVFNEGPTASGMVEVRIGIQSPVCGNGIVETNAGEVCDNTGGVGAVPCNAMCQVVTAGTASIPSTGPQLFSGSIASGFVLYQVDVTAEVYLRAETFAPNQASGCNTDTVLELYASNFAYLGGDGDGGTGTCSRLSENYSYTRLAPGRYWLLVAEAAGGAVPAYQLSIDTLLVGAGSPTMDLEPNDTQAQAQPTGLMSSGVATFQGALNPDGDDDVYAVEVPANTTLTLSARTYDTYGSPNTCSANSAQYDTRLFLELAGAEATAPNTGEIAYSDDISATEWCSVIANRVLAGGTTGATYYLRVQGYDDSGIREYHLQVVLQ